MAVDVNSALNRAYEELRNIDLDLSSLSGVQDWFSTRKRVANDSGNVVNSTNDRRILEGDRRIIVGPEGRAPKRSRHDDDDLWNEQHQHHNNYLYPQRELSPNSSRPQRTLSSVIMSSTSGASTIETKSRTVVITEKKKKNETKEDIVRNRRLFSNLVVRTLRQFQKEEKTVGVKGYAQLEKQRERRLEENEKENRERLLRERDILMEKRRDKETQNQTLHRQKPIEQSNIERLVLEIKPYLRSTKFIWNVLVQTRLYIAEYNGSFQMVMANIFVLNTNNSFELRIEPKIFALKLEMHYIKQYYQEKPLFNDGDLAVFSTKYDPEPFVLVYCALLALYVPKLVISDDGAWNGNRIILKDYNITKEQFFELLYQIYKTGRPLKSNLEELSISAKKLNCELILWPLCREIGNYERLDFIRKVKKSANLHLYDAIKQLCYNVVKTGQWELLQNEGFDASECFGQNFYCNYILPLIVEAFNDKNNMENSFLRVCLYEQKHKCPIPSFNSPYETNNPFNVCIELDNKKLIYVNIGILRTNECLNKFNGFDEIVMKNDGQLKLYPFISSNLKSEKEKEFLKKFLNIKESRTKKSMKTPNAPVKKQNQQSVKLLILRCIKQNKKANMNKLINFITKKQNTAVITIKKFVTKLLENNDIIKINSCKKNIFIGSFILNTNKIQNNFFLEKKISGSQWIILNKNVRELKEQLFETNKLTNFNDEQIKFINKIICFKEKEIEEQAETISDIVDCLGSMLDFNKKLCDFLEVFFDDQ